MPVDPTGLLAALALVPGIGPYLVYLPIIVALCKLVTVACPPPVAGSRWLGVYKLVSAVALNFGYAANAIPAGLPPSVARQVEAAATVTAAVPMAAAAQEAAEMLLESKAQEGAHV